MCAQRQVAVEFKPVNQVAIHLASPWQGVSQGSKAEDMSEPGDKVDADDVQRGTQGLALRAPGDHKGQ